MSASLALHPVDAPGALPSRISSACATDSRVDMKVSCGSLRSCPYSPSPAAHELCELQGKKQGQAASKRARWGTEGGKERGREGEREKEKGKGKEKEKEIEIEIDTDKDRERNREKERERDTETTGEDEDEDEKKEEDSRPVLN